MEKNRRRRARALRKRLGRPPAPYLLPECPIEYARGLYQGEGSHFCAVERATKRARLVTGIEMLDREALEPVIPCFGAPITKGSKREPTPLHPETHHSRITRTGKPATDIAEALSVTPYRKRQIKRAYERCRKRWREGYLR